MIYANAELHNVRMMLPLEDGNGFRLGRFPAELLPKLNPAAQISAFYPGGCELRFNLLGPEARIILRLPVLSDGNPFGIAEVWFGSFPGPWQFTSYSIGQEPTSILIQLPEEIRLLEALSRENNLPFDPRLVRVFLPYQNDLFLIGIEGEIAPPRAEQSPARKLLCYGSSITHGWNAVHPSQSFAFQTAERLGLDLLNLGLAGSAQMEPELASFIAGLDWDIATLEMGINVLGGWESRFFAERVVVFVETIAKAHPERWIFCTDLFTCLADLQGYPRIGEYRQAVRRIVANLNQPRLIYLDGRSLLDSPSGLSTDLVHPSPKGMGRIAERLSAAIENAVHAA